MKKTIIGAAFLLCGTIIDTAIIISAATYSASLNSWVGSKLWYAIFGAPTYDIQANLSLNLGFPFVFGAAILLCGAAILVMEFFNIKASAFDPKN